MASARTSHPSAHNGTPTCIHFIWVLGGLGIFLIHNLSDGTNLYIFGRTMYFNYKNESAIPAKKPGFHKVMKVMLENSSKLTQSHIRRRFWER